MEETLRLYCVFQWIYGFVRALLKTISCQPTARILTLSIVLLFTVRIASTAQTYTIGNQEPITNVPSSNSLFSMRLPVDVVQHKATNSDAMAQTALTDAGRLGASSSVLGLSPVWYYNKRDMGIPTYYGTANDPSYVIPSWGCAHHGSGTYDPSGIPFHAPNQAQFNLASSDNFLVVWDQTNNQNIAMYCGAGSCAGKKLPNCAAGNVCTITGISYCARAPRQSSSAYGMDNNPWASPGYLPNIGEMRVKELMSGHINHALYLNLNCTEGYPVFPDIYYWATASLCSSLGLSRTNRPPNGSLFFFDYTASQLAQIKQYLPAWQYPYVEAMTYYGGYIGDTSSGAYGLVPSRIENANAYVTAGLKDPLLGWLSQFPTAHCDGYQCNTAWNALLANAPSCPASLCDVTRHVHVANPCVAAGMAGVTSNPTPCVGLLQATVSGPGTISSTPSGVNCDRGSSCNMAASNGTTVILKAQPAPGHVFKGWNGACSGIASCTITLDGTRGKKIVTAIFS
jgi:uncharacterized repeat protein (TIGR02543 family)